MTRLVLAGIAFALTVAAAPPPPVPTAAAPPDEAQALGRKIAEAGDFQAIVATAAKAQSLELVRAHPELLPAERKQLMATAQARFLADRGALLDQLGGIYAGYFTLPELRTIAGFFASAAGKRYTGRLGVTVPAMAAALGKLDFKGEVLKAFCARSGKACPAPAGVPPP